MNSFLENWGPGMFDTSWWNLAGWTMGYFLVVGTVVACAGAMLRFFCRRAAPAVRYSVSLAVFMALALLPIGIAAWLAPTLAQPSRLETTKSALNSTSSPPRLAVARRPHQDGGAMGDLAVPFGDTAGSTSSLAVAQAPRQVATATRLWRDEGAMGMVRGAIGYLPWVWIVGAPITFALLATGLVGSVRLRRKCVPVATGIVAERCARLRRSLRITRQVGVVVCDRIVQPVLVGIVRPLVLLPPAALTGWSPEELEMVLLHELAHVRRWDNLVNLLQRMVESVLFFHPAVWLVSRQVRRDREDCCDAVVVGHTAKPQAYAELLVNIAAQGSRGSSLATASALADHPLAGRVRRILKIEEEPMLVSRNTLGVFTLAALVLVAGVLWQPVTSSVAEETDGSVAADGITTEGTEDTEGGGFTAEVAESAEGDTSIEKLVEPGKTYKVPEGSFSIEYEFLHPEKVFSDPKAGTIWHDTQIALIKSHLVLNNAIKSHDLHSTSVLRTRAEPLVWLHSNLKVQILPNSIRLELIGKPKNKKEIFRILQAIEASYKEELTAEATVPAIPVFLPLEQQRVVDLAYKLLGIELGQIGVDELARVKAKKFEGGLLVTEDGGGFGGNLFAQGDILVGLHVWPTKSLKDVAKILQRDDIAELSPLKFFVIRQQHTEVGFGRGRGVSENMVDKLITGRVTVNFDAIKKKMTVQVPESAASAFGEDPFGPRKNISDPFQPQKIAPGDELLVQVEGAFPDQPIDDVYRVEPAGSLALGPTYGRVEIVGKTLLEAEKVVVEHLSTILTGVVVQITWGDAKANDTTLYYDGKTFEEWRRMWKTELKTEKRTECISALAAFGRAGRDKEAVEAILDVAGEYDFLVLDKSAEGKFKERVLELLPKNFPTSLWFTSLMQRYDSDAKKWENLVMQLFGRLHVKDEKIRQRLLEFAHSDNDLRASATRALLQNDRELKRPETVALVRKALQGERPDVGLLSQLHYQQLDRVPEQFDLLFHEDLNIRKWARGALVQWGDAERYRPLIDKLLEVLDDPAQSKKHIDAIRAISSMSGYSDEDSDRLATRMRKIVREGDEQLLGAALYVLERVMAASLKIVIRRIGEEGLSEDRKKLLNDTESIQKLVNQEKRLVTRSYGGGGGGGGFF